MSRNSLGNRAASVRQRLLNRSRATGEDYNILLVRYAMERFLYRLSCSEYRDRFVLKGAVLFTIWEGDLHRVTRDLDLLGYGPSTTATVEDAIRAIVLTDVDPDGIVFDSETVHGAVIREDQEYQGVRAIVKARIGSARVQLQIDIGFGDAITPGALDVAFPTMLDEGIPMLRAYPKETVVAEKMQAIVVLGMANSRMKDYFDVHYLATHFDFDGELLTTALEATFSRRQTAIPDRQPVGLSDDFVADRMKQMQWRAFLKRSRITTGASLE